MKKYNIHEAKTNLSKIISMVQEGETVYLAKSGKIVAEVKPVKEMKRKPFPFGKYKDKITVTEDWDSDEVNRQIADSSLQEDMENLNSPGEIDGQVHPKYKRNLSI